jgi:salicylate 5-hydroxylase small subunit
MRSTRLDAETLIALHELYADYAATLDSADFSRWPDFFTEACIYKLQSRENFEAGLPLATLYFESRGMLKDRVYGAAETIYHHPYYQRHITGLPRLLERDGEVLVCEASYVVIRTPRDSMPEVLSVGRYLDRVVPTADGLKFQQRLAIFDNDLIANSLIKPI